MVVLLLKLVLINNLSSLVTDRHTAQAEFISPYYILPIVKGKWVRKTAPLRAAGRREEQSACGPVAARTAPGSWPTSPSA